MKKLAIASALLFAFAAPAAQADKLKVRLIGYQEVPALSTPASAEFEAKIVNDDTAIEWQLTYSATPTPIQQAHIHFGQRGVNGGISIWLCGNVTNTPPGVQACPPGPATIEGTADSGDVVGPAGQGIAPTELAEIIAAIRAGVAYVNVHTTQFPGGEIRGQFHRTHRGH